MAPEGISPKGLVVRLALHLRDAVRPHLGGGQKRTGVGESGDVSFPLDQVAEEALEAFLERWPQPVAFFSEDRGWQGEREAEYLLVVDPVDGSRPARLDLETCTVSVALAPHRPGACLGDVLCACVAELKGPRWFYAQRGEGVEIWREGKREPLRLRSETHLADTPWSLEITGRPFRLVAEAVGALVDASSLAGGVFCFASSSYSLTRLLTGQLGAFVDVSDRIRREFPQWESHFLQAGLGHIIALFPYDIAAALLLAEEAGAVVTDAYGRSLASVPLADTSLANQLSCVAAANASLHQTLLEGIEAGLARLHRLQEQGWEP